jgi:hypothetical protein
MGTRRTTDGGFRFRSASLSHSLIMANLVGVVVASVGIALFAWSRFLRLPWHIAAATGLGQVVIVTVLVVTVLEQRRKRSIRLAQEFAFLNRHIRNALPR